jgi:NAD dependent epimerase/dehydratase family enzyme
MGSGRQWMSWIHPADEVGGLGLLLEQPGASGAFNLTAPQPVTNRTFAATLGKVLRRPSWFPVPAFGLKVAFGEVATTVLDGQRALPERLSRLGYTFRFPSLEPALRDLLA